MATFPTTLAREGASALDAFEITPGPTDFEKSCRAIYVGGAGDISLLTIRGSTVTFANVPAGLILPVQATRVLSTGTTATSLVGLS